MCATSTNGTNLDCFEDAVVEVRETRVLIHHTVDQLSELQQEGFAGGEAITLQRLDQLHHMGNNLFHQTGLIYIRH